MCSSDLGFLLEMQGRLLKRSCPPRVTRYGAWLLGRYLEYSTDKACRLLGWQPSISYEESIGRTVQWFQEQEGIGSAASRRAGQAIDSSPV